SLVIPCHRIVREDGGLGGYRWGLGRKEKLLERERRRGGEAETGGDRVTRGQREGDAVADSSFRANRSIAPCPRLTLSPCYPVTLSPCHLGITASSGTSGPACPSGPAGATGKVFAALAFKRRTFTIDSRC